MEISCSSTLPINEQVSNWSESLDGIPILRWSSRGVELMNYDHSRGKLTVSKTLLGSSPPFDALSSRVEFVFGDLFCLSESYGMHSRTLLVNPFRHREVVGLPKVHDSLHWHYGLGIDELTNKHCIIAISRVKKYLRKAKVLELGTSLWKNIKPKGIPKFFHKCQIFSEKGVCAYGDMHWLFLESARRDLYLEDPEEVPDCDVKKELRVQILSFNFKKGSFYTIPFPFDISGDRLYHSRSNLHLITFRGSMAIVKNIYSEEYMEIWPMTDFDAKKWGSGPIIKKQKPESGILWLYCYEWEHGIFFLNFDWDTALFFDMDNDSMKIVKCPANYGPILSFKRCFTSIVDLHSLTQEPEEH